MSIVSKYTTTKLTKIPACKKNIIKLQDFGYDKDSHQLIIIDSGEEDRDAYIQSFEKECGVYNILAMFSKTGDESLFNVSPGVYADISDLPVDDLDVAGAQAKAATALDSLKDKLGVDISADQLASMTLDDINALIAKAIDSKNEKVTESKSADVADEVK